MDNYEKMEELKEALDEARAGEDRPAEAAALYNIGRLYAREKVAEAAEDFWGQCLAIRRELDQPEESARVLIDLADLALTGEDLDLARGRYREALVFFRRIEHVQGQVRVLERLGSLALKEEAPDLALGFFQEGLALCRAHEDKVGCLFFHDQIIPLLKARGADREVEQSYREAITLAESLGDRERMALGLVGLADLYLRTGPPDEAVPYLMMAHDIYLRLGQEKEAGLILEALGRMGVPPPSKPPE